MAAVFEANPQTVLLDLDVVFWRFDCLERAGYPSDVAATLAESADVDLHDAVELVRRGCPVEQAVEILR